MKRILLCCAAGMSTSMVVNRMKQAAAEQRIDVEIKAVGIEEFTDIMPEFDCCLLGPQIKYRLEDFKAQAAPKRIPVTVINSMDYGMMRGDRILADALALIA
ncbi:PTS sugar transporter subunit IIB [Cedecea davisae]|uniref:PTS sugar transporter subunit IIB n=1 Tax=Cedecea davisae TaxID=158484 RepID=A0ABS6DFM2_9ENTR|nr:PTS sugar transporter subunit IIB [Cedecea davisae]MBU4681997.1 PTS sugar transporter subunit IIB [Cedecea davisae]MBU4686133.1 PTS sugar transporter subunit IIB [Cedecea davisae]